MGEKGKVEVYQNVVFSIRRIGWAFIAAHP
jgi:hypothetical protein